MSTVATDMIEKSGEIVESGVQVPRSVLTEETGCHGPSLVVTKPGVCPVKPEFLREVFTARVFTDGKTRGMNKGSERQHVEGVVGTERPTFEGEINFLNGDALTRVKGALRSKSAGGNQPHNDNDKRPRDGVAADQPLGLVAVASAECNDDDKNAQAREGRKEAAAGEHIAVTTPADDNRARNEKAHLLFQNKVILAPLTTVGNLPYRRICKEFGADNTVSEMALVYNLNKTQKSEWSLLRRHDSEDVFGMQVAVSRPDDAMAFAKAIEASGFSYDYIDINCGCPVDMIVKSGCGCGLWERKSRLREVVKMLTKFQSKPVTIKCRIGPDETAPTLHYQIDEYESWGCSAVTIHGRSRKQRYTKLANWNYVEQCAQKTNLPVVGNGDILSWEDVELHRKECPTVSSYLVARGALIKPWIFDEIRNKRTLDISSNERFEMLQKYAKYGLAHWGSDEKGVLATRRFLCEWLSFLYRYVPVGLLERLPQRINERPPVYEGRDDMETLMASDSVYDWIKITEMLLGPAGDKFVFTPKHKSNSYVAGAPSATNNNIALATDDVEIEG